jgi:signal peptidase II
MLFYLTALIVFIIDQLTKIAVRANVELNETFTWLGFEFKYIENSGMAGGLLPGYARVFGIISVLFVLFVLYLRKDAYWRGGGMDVGLGLLVGGAIGNGFDRLVFGQVTDFIVRSGGILNIADHALELGIITLILREVIHWIKRRKEKRAEKRETEAGG